MIFLYAYRLLLFAFPTDVRREHGVEMQNAFVHMLDRCVGWRRWTFAGRAMLDTVREGLAERGRRMWQAAAARGARGESVYGDEEGMMFGDLTDDVKLALRGFARSRGVSAVLVLTLALGIGASTAVFSVLDGVLFRALPFDQPEELVTLRHAVTEIPDAGLQGIPGPDLLDYIEGAPAIEAIGSVFTLATNLNDDQGAVRVTIGWVTPDLFPALGTEASVGRMLDPADWTPRTRVQMEDPTFSPPPMPVMLTAELWGDRFGADPDLVGQSVTINGTRMNVVGVLPPGFHVYAPANSGIPSRIDVFSYMPLPMTEGGRGAGQGISIGRLAEGATLEQATTQLEGVNESLRSIHERHARLGTRVVVAPLLDGVVGESRSFLWVLFGSIGLVLLIAVLNVANLLLVRAADRQQEFAVRIALGGSRFRLIRQLITESFVLAAFGALAGIAVASVGVGILVSLAPPDLPRVEAIGIDGGVLLFTVGISSLAAMIFGLIPAVASSGVHPASLVAARRSIGVGRAGTRLRGMLIVGEVALSVLLVAGAGLLVRSFGELASVDAGYEPEGAVAVEIALPFFTYRGLETRQAFFDQLLTEAVALPGVTAAGIAPRLPLTGTGGAWSAAYGQPGAELSAEDASRATYRPASPGFFEALGVPLLEGRTFETGEGGPGGELVVVIDRSLAEREWPDGDAIGSSLQVSIAAYIGQGREATARVVGVVEPVRYETLTEAGGPVIWVPFNEYASLEAALVMRGPGDPLVAAAQIREVLAGIDPSAPVYAFRRLTDDVRTATAQTRYAMLLMAIFAASALALAAIGLYGVISSTVQQRTREIGVRLALGAPTRDIGAMVLVQGGRLAFVGIVLGVAASLLASPLIESLLYDVEASDPLTLAGTAFVLALVAALATWLPAVRASRLDPVDAIRTE